jgi:hypothetical protein
MGSFAGLCEPGNRTVSGAQGQSSRLHRYPTAAPGSPLPTSSASRPASTAPTCSTRTRVVSPSNSISGRNDAGLALQDIGATSTTERGRNSLAWNDHAVASALLLVTGPARKADSWTAPPVTDGRRVSAAARQRHRALELFAAAGRLACQIPFGLCHRHVDACLFPRRARPHG